MSKKQLKTRAISNELAGGASLFFKKDTIPSPAIVEPEKNVPEAQTVVMAEIQNPENGGEKHPIEKAPLAVHDGMDEINPDVVTSIRNEVTLRDWKDIIENTETHNSSLRLTNEENYAVEDLINELKRSLKIKVLIE